MGRRPTRVASEDGDPKREESRLGADPRGFPIGRRISAHACKGQAIVFEDRSLIRRSNAGDAEALRRIYEKFKPALFAVAGALLHDAAAVEDVVHDLGCA